MKIYSILIPDSIMPGKDRRHITAAASNKSVPSNSSKSGISLPAVPAFGSSSTTNVKQLLVSLNLEKGTEVVIKRSTSLELHGKTGIIEGKGPGPNDYMVQVDGESLVIAAYQLVMPGSSLGNAPVETDMAAVAKLSADEIQLAIMTKFREAFQPELPFMVGGSAAVLIHAFSKGTAARTPRDIDIFVQKADFKKISPGTPSHKPVRLRSAMWGIPFEMHESGSFGAISGEEAQTGILGPDKLLAQELIKLRKQAPYYFKKAIPDPGTDVTADGILSSMKAFNDELMNDQELNNNSKEVWMKTLLDIETLINSGATTKAYHQGKK